MDISKITSHCGLDEPFQIYSKNTKIIAHADYTNSCVDLQVLYDINNDGVIYNFTNPDYHFGDNNIENFSSDSNNIIFNNPMTVILLLIVLFLFYLRGKIL